MKLRCGVYGEGNVFSVDIELEKDVEALKEAIASTYRVVINRVEVYPATLTLYLARKKGSTTWMKHDHNTESFLQGGIDTDYDEMLSSWTLDDEEYFGTNFQPRPKQIHVLVELPEAAAGVGVLTRPRKRKLSEERLVKLKDLWDYSKMTIAALPKPTKLKTMLAQQFPFRLSLDDDKIAEEICKQNGDVVQCKDLTTIIESFLLDCTSPVKAMASENTWQAFYDVLFRIQRNIPHYSQESRRQHWDHGEGIASRSHFAL